MNNRRLLTGLLVAILLGSPSCAFGQEDKIIPLEKLFEIADSNSAQLSPYITAELEAKQELKVAKSKRLPDIETYLSLGYNGSGFTTKRNFSDYQKAPIPHFNNTLSVTVTQPVYTGGAITAGIDLASLKSTAARYAADLKQDNIRFQITGYYLDIYKYHNLRSVVENNILQAQEVLKDMQGRYEQGIALKNDITRYELLIKNYELQLIKINNMITILNRNLTITIGLPYDLNVRPDTTILNRSLPINEAEWWQREAAENAPALKLGRSNVEINRKAEALVKSESLPKIGLQAGWTIDGPILVEVPPINRNLSYWYIGIGVNYNIASLYKNNKTLSKSRIATKKAEEELTALTDDIKLNVHSDYIKYLEAYEELKTQQKSLELAELNYKTTATRYSADMALITDMLDAANSKLDAEQNLVNARINIIYYYYKLLFTTGKI